MKTATVTWVTYNNYGTLLQAYALQQQLKKEGIKNVILSDRDVLRLYKAENLNQVKKSGEGAVIELQNRQFRLLNLLANPKRISRVILARINRKEYERPYIESQEKCELFKKENLAIFNEVDAKNLIKLNEHFDVFIAGSDQVWAVFETMFNPYYYLDFVKKKKIAYAPSLGTDIFPKRVAEKIKKLLSDFSAISVREKETANQMSELIGRKVEWVVDPTLLHDNKFWSEFTAEVPVRKKKYLLCYFLENKDWYFEYAKDISRQLHIEIVLMPNKWDYISNGYVIKNGVGPKEFVSLIQHAEYVLTDSYHGSIFSLIFERNFQYLLRFSMSDPNSQNIRIQSLFDYLNLNDRIISDKNIDKAATKIENYNLINKKIENFRIRSQNYLRECLQQHKF